MPAATPVRLAGALFVALLFGSAAALPQAASAQPAARLSGPQIAGVAATAGTIDVENAKLALRHATNTAVRAFAVAVIRDHRTVDAKARGLTRTNVPPAAMSRALIEQSRHVRGQLSSLSGADFDRAYLDNEVAFDQTVVSAISTRLIPAAREPRLRQFLMTERNAFASQARRAGQIAGRLH